MAVVAGFVMLFVELWFINSSAQDRGFVSEIINKATTIDNTSDHVEKSQSQEQVQMAAAKRGPKTHAFPGDKATTEWLDSSASGTQPNYRNHWRRFLEHVNMTGDQILESRKADKESAWEKRALTYKEFLKTQKNRKGEPLSEYFVRQSTVVIRSFFAFHRADLKFRHSERTRLREAKPKTEDYRFTRDDLQKMAEVADLEDKYVVVVGKSFGLRASDFLQLFRREVAISFG